MALDHVGWQGELSTQVLAGFSEGHGLVMGGTAARNGYPQNVDGCAVPHAEWMLGKPVEF